MMIIVNSHYINRRPHFVHKLDIGTMIALWLFLIVSEITNLISIGLSFLFIKKLNFPSKLIIIHLILFLVSNISSSILSLFVINNYFVLHLMTILDLLIVGYFYSCVIHFSRKKQTLLVGLIAFGVIFSLLESFVFSSLKVANVYSIVVVGLIKILLIVNYFITLLGQIGSKEELNTAWISLDVLDSSATSTEKQKQEFTSKDYAYWNIFSASLLIYTASSMLFFLFMNVLMSLNLLMPFVFVNMGVYTIAAFLVLYGIIRFVFGNKTF